MRGLELVNGMGETLNPAKGNGIYEAVTTWLLIIGVFVLLLVKVPVPSEVMLLLGLSVGTFMGVKAQQHAK